MANRTGTVVAILLAFGVAWEVWTLVNSIPGDTISETVWAAIHDNPIIVFVTGILNGHWFWQRKPKPCPVCSARIRDDAGKRDVSPNPPVSKAELWEEKRIAGSRPRR
jgi:hypothetical protein